MNPFWKTSKFNVMLNLTDNTVEKFGREKAWHSIFMILRTDLYIKHDSNTFLIDDVLGIDSGRT